MNAEKRVLKTIEGREPDRVPSFESLITNNSLFKHYQIPIKNVEIPKLPSKMLMRIVENAKLFKENYKNNYTLYQKIGIDIVPIVTTFYPYLSLDKNKYVDEYGRILQQEYYTKDKTAVEGYIGGYFKSFEDYESWERPDPAWEARINHYDVAKEVQRELNDQIFCIPGTGALMEVSWESFGLETFSKILAKTKQAKKIFDDNGRFTLEFVKIFSEIGANLIILYDDMGYKNGLFMSPRNYQKYVFPWYKRICDAAHKNDCKILLHSDGDLFDIFEDIINCGVDAIHPIEPTTANPDYDIFKLGKKYQDKITFIGNVSPMMLASAEVEEIKHYATRLIKELAPGGRYIFGSGHSINPAVTLNRFEAMYDVKRKYGSYPINIPK
ncbi:MAG: hypothetical protein GF383_06715 [Candidatus Lokiarchaeota archaeon]|nr:hypothetical protein [Candidatus Lokiarchaeota archaeon]MBD3339809.1 hypothetical protein [Candidatus Lokiarchaeota archaeon]